MNKSADAFRTISEVSEELDVPKHVLRFWEARFPQIKPMKRGGGRRYYRPQDVELLKGIRHLLHAEGYTIRGVQKILRQNGIDAVKTSAQRASEPASRASEKPVRAGGRAKSAPRTTAAPIGPAELSRALAALVAEMEAMRALLRGDEAATPGAARAGGVRRRARPAAR